MKTIKKLVCTALCAALAVAGNGFNVADAEGKSMDIVIDGSKLNLAENRLYRGAGMVSGNNTSRLLLDYKAENPEAYREILSYLFSSDGVGINHLKLEMGADINSSSGTEPTVMRTEDEKADVTRGAGYQLAADALEINPELTLDMLYWSEPLWVTNAEDVYAARYKWYRETLVAAYETYGLEFDFVSAVRNEKPMDPDWVIYLSKALKSDTDAPYDFSAIKIVAADEVCGWGIANSMLADEELMAAVDVLGSHYTSWSTDNVKTLQDEYGKEVWFTEGCPPMSYSQGTYRFDSTGSGLNDINGMLDVANRFITMYPGGGMTLYEYQPAVAAYYDGATYCQKQLITANEPWSGYYLLDGGFYMSLHFSKFIKQGWAFADEACCADGKAGGDGHAVVDAVYSYITAADTETGDYSTVITNTTADPITYSFTVKNLNKASAAAYVWETRGPDGGEWNENYFINTDKITPTESGDGYTYSVTVKPYSLVTVSTVEAERGEYEKQTSDVMALPYSDDYEYADYPEGFLASRGNAPRYTTDEGGAFEVRSVNGNNVLMQMITPEIKAEEWGGTPSPMTNFGDDRWLDYSVSSDVFLAECDAPDKNFVGVGLRYCLASSGMSGYWFQLNGDGSWKLRRNARVKLEGTVEDFDGAAIHNIRVEAVGNTVKAYLDGELTAQYNGADFGDAMLGAGRAAFYSTYNNNWFDNFKAEPAEGGEAYVTRLDNTDLEFGYAGEWKHNTMSGYANYKRTISDSGENAELSLSFTGNGFIITGISAGAELSVEVDGGAATSYTVPKALTREVLCCGDGLEAGEHKAVIKVVSGGISVDGAQITGSATFQAADEAPAEELTTSDSAGQPGAEQEKKSGFPIIPVAIGAAALAVAAAAVAFIIRKKKK